MISVNATSDTVPLDTSSTPCSRSPHSPPPTHSARADDGAARKCDGNQSESDAN
jgi:hypothetical protein